MQDTINVGLASYGMSGRVFHAPVLSVVKDFVLYAICERTTNSAQQRYPSVKLCRSFDELLSIEELSLVVVNTPDHTHYDFCKKALLAGKHVVVEKPFTLRYAHALDLLALAEKKKRILSVFQNRRWDNDFITVQQVLTEQRLGRLVEMISHFDRFRPQPTNTWKEKGVGGTGNIYNLGSHLIDQAIVLFGMPRYVYADICKLRDQVEADDYFDVKLYYDNLMVTLKSSYLAKEAGPRFVLHGTNGSFVKYGYDPQEEALKQGKYPDEQGWGTEEEKYWGQITLVDHGKEIQEKVPTIPGNYCYYYKNIAAAIHKGEKLAVTAHDGAKVIQLIEAAILSNREGHKIAVSK